MSVYKAVSNYYIDILDYLTIQTKPYNGDIDKYFSKIKESQVEELLSKLSDTLLKINQLFKSRVDYYEGRAKEHNAIIGIFITIAIIMGIIIYIIFGLQMWKEITFKNLTNIAMLRIFQNFLTYTIAYMVILTIFILIIINAKKMKKLFKNEVENTKIECTKFTFFIFKKAGSNVAYMLFTLAKALAIANGSNENNYLTVDYSGTSVIPEIDCGNISSITKIKAVDNKYYECKSKTAKYQAVFADIKKDLSSALKDFCKIGKDNTDSKYVNSYTEVRKIYVLSSPIPMLNETKRIMNAYNRISTKSGQGVENVPVDEKKTQAILKEKVVKPLLLALNITTVSKDANALTLNLIDLEFKMNYINLKKLFLYTSAYIYQISEQNLKIDINIMPKNLSNEDNDPFKTQIKTFFAAHEINKLPSYMTAGNNQPQIHENIENALNDILPLFKTIYNLLNSKAKSNNYIIFDNEIVNNDLMIEISSSQSFKDDYKSYIKKTIYNHIVLPIKFEYDADSVKIQTAIDNILNSMTGFKIDIAKYNDYIMSEFTKSVPASEITSKADLVTDALSSINKSLKMRKQLQKKEVENKFLETHEFLEVINKMKYTEINDMLETDFLDDIVSQFYNTINLEVTSENASLKNIFYREMKNTKLSKTAVILTTTIIILLLINYLTSTSMLAPYLYTDIEKKVENTEKEYEALQKAAITKSTPEVQEEKQLLIKGVKYELDLLYRERRNRTANFTVRLFVPIFVVVFIIALMNAAQKKAESKSRFNREMIENNTYKLKTLVKDLNKKMVLLDELFKSSPSNKMKKISDIKEITDEQKQELFKNIKDIVERYDKCNFILEAGKSKLPFPYSEVAMGGFMIFVTSFCMIYVFMQISPAKKLVQIKELNKMSAEAAIADKVLIKSIKKELEYLTQCHEDDLDTIVFTLKVVFFVFIIAFLIFYSSKVVSSTSEYTSGLYNSGYFETENCIT